jgi:hypothetical protein
MKNPLGVLLVLLVTSAFATEVIAQAAESPVTTPVHRYLVERTFPAGALKGLDAATKKKVNANNASVAEIGG